MTESLPRTLPCPVTGRHSPVLTFANMELWCAGGGGGGGGSSASESELGALWGGVGASRPGLGGGLLCLAADSVRRLLAAIIASWGGREHGQVTTEIPHLYNSRDGFLPTPSIRHRRRHDNPTQSAGQKPP